MDFYTPPGFLEAVFSATFWVAVFNTACLILVLFWWRSSDQTLFESTIGPRNLYSAADRRQTLNRLREDYFYYTTLPLFVERSPLRLLLKRDKAPSLGPVLVALFVQSLPILSVFTASWYVTHGIWHVWNFVTEKAKEYTPAPVKRFFFTPWF